MRLLALITKTILFLLLLGFAAKNSDTVTLRYFMAMEWQLPLSLLMLIVFSIGLLVGVLGCSRRLFRQRRQVQRLQAALGEVKSVEMEK